MSLETKDIVAFWKRSPVLCSCIALTAVLLLSLYFRMGVREELEGKLTEQVKLRNKLAANVKYAAGLNEHTERLREVNAALTRTALKAGELALNQQFFLRLEAETGVKIIDLRPLAVPPPAKGAPSTGYVPLGFSLSVSGNYTQLLKFITRIEKGQTLGKVRSASIAEPEAAGEQTVTLMVDLLGLRQ